MLPIKVRHDNTIIYDSIYIRRATALHCESQVIITLSTGKSQTRRKEEEEEPEAEENKEKEIEKDKYEEQEKE